jgi:hypothetical protein
VLPGKRFKGSALPCRLEVADDRGEIEQVNGGSTRRSFTGPGETTNVGSGLGCITLLSSEPELV